MKLKCDQTDCKKKITECALLRRDDSNVTNGRRLRLRCFMHEIGRDWLEREGALILTKKEAKIVSILELINDK